MKFRRMDIVIGAWLLCVHHAFVETPQFSADTGDIPPGESRDIVFTKAGTYTIRCAIHPQMRLIVEVSEQE